MDFGLSYFTPPAQSKNFIEDVTVSDILKTNNATKRTLTALYNEILEKINKPNISKDPNNSSDGNNANIPQ